MSEVEEQPEREVPAKRANLAIRIVNFPLVTLVVATALFVAGSALAFWLLSFDQPISPAMQAITEASLTIGTLWVVYKLAISKLGWNPRDELPITGAVRETAAGLGLGFGLMSVIVAVAAILGVYRIVGWGSTDSLLFNLFAVALLPGFREELLFRGILFRWLEQFGGSWLALLVTSALFGIAHIANPNASYFSSFAIAMEAGLLLGGAYMLTRNLWLAIGLHAGWNFTQGFIYDVPVSGLDTQGIVSARLSGPELLSGGQFGFEASLIALIVATIAGLWLVVKAVRKGHEIGPFWRQPWWREAPGRA